MEVESPIRPIEVMQPSVNAGNTSPKRKVHEEVDMSKPCANGGDEDGTVEKRVKTVDAILPRDAPESSTMAGPSSSVELRGRKLHFKQDPAPKLAPPRRKQLNFEAFLLDAEEAGKPLDEVPEEFWDVVVMAGVESTARTEKLFIKQLRSALTATADGEKEIISSGLLSTLIAKLFYQGEYGVLPTDFPLSNGQPAKIPVSMQIRCWEAKDLSRWIAGDQLEALRRRKAERERAREEVRRLIDGLDDVEKLELLKGDKGEKGEKLEKVERGRKERENQDEVEVEDSPLPKAETSKRKSREGTANTTESRRSASPSKKSKLSPEEEEAARVRKEEKEARRLAREEAKAAKEREEEKKRTVAAKQAQGFSAFFKAKPAVAVAPVASAVTPPAVKRDTPAGPSTTPTPQRESTPTISDFARTFKPVAMRANVEWAEINKWVKPRRRSAAPDEQDGVVRGVSGKDLEAWGQKGSPSTQGWQDSDFLRDHLSKHGKRARRPRANLPPGLKSGSLYGTVQEVWAACEDAEDPRKVLSQLKNRRKFPWKTLAFDQQVRPPYSGTFTKKSTAVGPRTPFAQDPIFDYSYDSGDDWQDDEGGEDVDDFGEAPAEEEDAEDESEGEFDDWLDDTEDGGFVPPPSSMDVDDDMTGAGGGGGSSGMEQARLQMKVTAGKKAVQEPVKKKVVKLTPSWKGPMWEGRIGDGSEGMEGYRLQLLNDTPDSFDPFTYTSAGPTQAYKASYTTIAIGSNLNVRCLHSAEPVAAANLHSLPASSDPSVSTTTATAINTANTGLPPSSSSSSTTTATSSTPPVKSRPGPKVLFPDSHLAEFLRHIEGSTLIRSDLISDLRRKFENVASKAAIDAKVKEVAVREGKKVDSPWRIRDEAWRAAGVELPSATREVQPPTDASAPMLVDA